MDPIGLSTTNRHGEIGNERTSAVNRRTGLANSCKTLQRLRDDGIYQSTEFGDKYLQKTGARLKRTTVSLDVAMVNIHTGWYYACTQGFET
jgi:hypothetical protein